MLEAEGVTIGAVTGVQGISWQELTITGQSNHAGTTPMRAAPRRRATPRPRSSRSCASWPTELGRPQVGTVGRIELHPDLVNVVAARADAHRRPAQHRRGRAGRRPSGARRRVPGASWPSAEGVAVSARPLARFEPVAFDPRIVDLVEAIAAALGHGRSGGCRRAPGHDAQMLARVCPAGDDLRAERRRHQPQPGRAHRPGRPRGRRQRAARRAARPGRLSPRRAGTAVVSRRPARSARGADRADRTRDETRKRRGRAAARAAAARPPTAAPSWSCSPSWRSRPSSPAGAFDDQPRSTTSSRREMPGPDTKPLFDEAARPRRRLLPRLRRAEPVDDDGPTPTVQHADRSSGPTGAVVGPLPQGPPARPRGARAVAAVPAPRAPLLRPGSRRLRRVAGLRRHRRDGDLQRPPLARDLPGAGPAGRRADPDRVQHADPLRPRPRPGPPRRASTTRS